MPVEIGRALPDRLPALSRRGALDSRVCRLRSLFNLGMVWEVGDAMGAAVPDSGRTVADADAPGGGPHVWFMRWDP
jgi:hypothetical protein